MKQFISVWLLGVLGISSPGISQMVMQKDESGKINITLLVPPSPVVPASALIKTAAVQDIKKPEPVVLNTVAQLEGALKNCPQLNAKTGLELDGERRNDALVDLQWKTKNGFDNAGFDVERSFNDTLHFEKVGYVWAKNVAGIKDRYELPDPNSSTEVTYYRLRLTLRSGGFLYSNIARVAGYRKNDFLIYPNPATNTLRVQATAGNNGGGAICVFDMTGKLVTKQSVLVIEGLNVKMLNLSNLLPGTYSIRLELPGNSSQTAKFVKQ